MCPCCRGSYPTTWRSHEQPLLDEERFINVFNCFFKDTVGIELIDRIGVDNVLFETDYPHQDGTFPHSKRVAEELFGHLDPVSVHKIARGNAIKLLGLDLAS